MEKTEEHNLKEEIKDSIKSALKKGIDNEGCSVYRVMRKEHFSPSGKAQIIDNGFYENILYKCNLCKACDKFNGVLCETFLKARQVLVLKGKETEANREMVKNIRKTGNAYGV